MDEVYLSTSLVKMNYLELVTKPLYYQQKAPLGFLWIVKFFINLFGSKEMALRIVPLISGIASLFLFIPIAKYFLKESGVVLAIGIFCLSPALTYHSVEIKQYATELFCAILSFYLLIKYKDKNTVAAMLWWGLWGAVILWFSYSSIFILAGIGMGLSLQYIIQKRWRHFFISLMPFCLWLFSFVVNYLLFTHKHAESAWIAYWFKAYDNFMPLPPRSVKDLMWFVMNIYRMLDYPLGLLWNFMAVTSHQGLNMLLKMPFIPLTFLAVGIYAFFRSGKSNLLLLVLPMCFMFLASGLELYPLTERFWVFISPAFIILIAKGFEFIACKIKSSTVNTLLFLLLITGPLTQSIYFLMHPEFFYSHKKSFQREALLFINKNYQPGDAVYVYWNNLPGYKLYKQIYNLNYTAIEGSDQRNKSANYVNYYHNLSPEFKQFANSKRVWLVYNNQFLTDLGDKIDEPKWHYKGQSPTKNLVNELFKTYDPLEKFTAKDITVYLLEPKH
jgi:4-amino-4-deoxy-L-arabinose transferase-like glycosyltransferase